MKERYRPKTYGEAMKELCDVLTPEFIQQLKKCSPDGRGRLGKVLGLCQLAKSRPIRLEGY